MQRIAPSGTVATGDLVDKLKREGMDIISFVLGEPDFDTPQHIIDAAAEAMNSGFTHYTPTHGIPELREAIAQKSKEENNISCETSNVFVTPTKFGLFASLLALVDEQHEVIITDPGFVSYYQMVNFSCANVKSVKVSQDNEFRLMPEDVAEAITPKTKVIILNSPCNPTGSVSGLDDLKGIADLAKDHNIFILTDEIYEKIIYEGEHHSMASLDDMFERTVTVNGFSKSYAMTGWRLGWIVATEEIIIAVKKIQQHSLTCAVSFAQKGGVAALKGSQEPVKEMVSEFRARRDLIVEGVNSIPGLSCQTPKGAFYAFVKFDHDMPSIDFAKFLIEKAHVAVTKAHVAVTPGSAFGLNGEGYLRISYAASRENITEGLKRIEKALAEL
jgi:aspartate aminotransferase